MTSHPSVEPDLSEPVSDALARSPRRSGALTAATLVLVGVTLFAFGLAAGVWLGSVPRPGPGASLPPVAEASPTASQPSETVAPTAAPTVREITLPTDGAAIGDADAPLELELWADYQCGYCGIFAQQVMPWLEENYIAKGTVRVVHRDFAFLGPASIDAAVLTRLAADEDRFWELHDLLYAVQGDGEDVFGRENLVRLAVQAGLDEAAARAAFDAADFRAAVSAEKAAAEAAGINSTPTLVFPDGTKISGLPRSATEFAAQLDAAIAAARDSPEAEE